MLGRLTWFVLGFATCAVLYKVFNPPKAESDHDFESLADDLSRRLANLETDLN